MTAFLGQTCTLTQCTPTHIVTCCAVALLTERIRDVSEHFAGNKKDFHNMRCAACVTASTPTALHDQLSAAAAMQCAFTSPCHLTYSNISLSANMYSALKRVGCAIMYFTKVLLHMHGMYSDDQCCMLLQGASRSVEPAAGAAKVFTQKGLRQVLLCGVQIRVERHRLCQAGMFVGV